MTAPRTPQKRVGPSWDALGRCFRDRVAHFSDLLSVQEPGGDEPLPAICTGSATDLPFEADAFDACVTSPPYATRIDYVSSVLPELAVLGATAEETRTLRRSSTGTPVVAGRGPADSLLSASGQQLVERIRIHKSQGSRNYYAPWMSKYLTDLQRGLITIDRKGFVNWDDMCGSPRLLLQGNAR